MDHGEQERERPGPGLRTRHGRPAHDRHALRLRCQTPLPPHPAPLPPRPRPTPFHTVKPDHATHATGRARSNARPARPTGLHRIHKHLPAPARVLVCAVPPRGGLCQVRKGRPPPPPPEPPPTT